MKIGANQLKQALLLLRTCISGGGKQLQPPAHKQINTCQPPPQPPQRPLSIARLHLLPFFYGHSMAPKTFRHAQTQHCSTSDDENIILCEAAIHSPAADEMCQPAREDVWFYELADTQQVDGMEMPVPVANEEQILDAADQGEGNKRKQPPDDEAEDAHKALKKTKLETKALKAKRPGFSDERYEETSYYLENGLRKVYPYYFTFTTFTKGRWVGEKILEVFSREFRAHPAEEYERSISNGNLTVNYERVSCDYRLKHNDLLANIVHRHEVPVTSEPITIVHMDEELVVVNKPASIPVHPCGRYRHNTVVFILAKEYNLRNLRTIHRLDRLTSGLLLFGRTQNKARTLEKQIRNREVHKQYVCRVEGEFPEGSIVCSEPIEVVSYKIGVCKVSPKGKDCSTTFERMSYNGRTSTVLCKPLTGRMHQIRVHLQYLGYPIANDPLYNHEVFGPLKGRGGDVGGKSDEQLIEDLTTIHNAETWLGIDGEPGGPLFMPMQAEEVDKVPGKESSNKNEAQSESNSIEGSNADAAKESIPHAASKHASVATQTDHEPPDAVFDPSKVTVDDMCYECKVRYKDPRPNDLVMYLHAWKYKGIDWAYETKLPAWASADWSEDQAAAAAAAVE